MDLNSKEAQRAWQDYKGFMMSMGMDLRDKEGVEQAFKFAYAKGQVDYRQPAPVAHKRPQKIVSRKTRQRSYSEIIRDENLVKSIMQRNPGPMQLHDITEAVNASGGNWYPKSASGHMRIIMERVPAIKKVAFGLYEYQR